MRKKIEGSACLDWIDLPIVIGGNACRTYVVNNTYRAHYYSQTQKANVSFYKSYGVEQFLHTGRIIGYVTDEVDIDGVPKIIVYGNNSTIQTAHKYIDAQYTMNSNYEFVNGHCVGDPHTLTYNATMPNVGTIGSWVSSMGIPYMDGNLPFLEAVWSEYTGNTPCVFLRGFSKYQGNNISTNRIWDLTTEDNNTLVLATGKEAAPDNLYHLWTTFTMDDISFYNGNVAEILEPINANGAGVVNGKVKEDFPINITTILGNGEKYNRHLCPYNLLLTKSKSQALRYISDGTLPNDVYLYPFDVDNIPQAEGSPDDGEDDPEENPEVVDTIQPTPIVTPLNTPSKLTNNNLYWLQAGELETFINWFWTEAGDIADLQDLWQKIQGLYNNLASALINIRYMPIDISWVGGTTDVNNIILGQLNKVMNVKKINRGNSIVRPIGSIKIDEIYKSFTDYSPYSSIMLYLPYHGFIDINNDLIMGQTLSISAVYDILSGSIQYFIFRNQTLINTIIAKMAVDIPITLQSKSERDSAIFSNISNATASIMGAVSSAVTSNPIGLVMSTENIANGGAQTAPFSLKGTVGETGAFYAPNKCAIYIERPRYNKPQLYAERVGYPLNKNYRLSALKGFTTVYNPVIQFSGNTVTTDNTKVFPLQSEIDEIYSLLEKGVIL